MFCSKLKVEPQVKGREGLHTATNTLMADSLHSQIHLIRSSFRISNHFCVSKSYLCVIANTLPLSSSRKRRQFSHKPVWILCFCSDIQTRKMYVRWVHHIDTIHSSHDYDWHRCLRLKGIYSGISVAELGSLSSGAKMAMKVFVKRVFTIFASNASFLRVIANLQN